MQHTDLIEGRVSEGRETILKISADILVMEETEVHGSSWIQQKGVLCNRYMCSLTSSTLEPHSPVLCALYRDPLKAPSDLPAYFLAEDFTSMFHPSPELKQNGDV